MNIFCKLGWHRWDVSTSDRTCLDCNKKQYIKGAPHGFKFVDGERPPKPEIKPPAQGIQPSKPWPRF